MNMLAGTALGDYGHPVFKRDGFICVYCGFDGNGFNGWRQLSLDHLRPVICGGTDSGENLVTACSFCNSATSRMRFSQEQTASEILELKKARVKERSQEFYKFWSREVAPVDDALTPAQGGAYLPNPLVLKFCAFDTGGDQFLQFCADNDDPRFRLELTAKQELLVMPPAHTDTALKESELGFQLGLWAREDGTGLTFNSQAGFTLPNGAVRAPDASWVLRERYEHWKEKLRAEDKEDGFADIAPDFVIELRSRSDTLASQQAKMEEYIENGVRLGWLIDPRQRRVYVYRSGRPVEVLEAPESVSGEAVLPGFVLNLQEIW